MKKGKCLFLLFALFLLSFRMFSQTIEIGASYASGNTSFYKNVPGGFLGFNYHFKNQYLFSQLSSSLKNYSFTESTHPNGPWLYEVHEKDGRMNVNSIKLGIAQKISDTKEHGIYFGIYGSLNYFKFEEVVKQFEYAPGFEPRDTSFNRVYSRNNKKGLGCFLDLELKNFIFQNTSLFTKINAELIEYEGNVMLSFIDPRILAMNFQLGIRVDFRRGKYCEY